MRKLGLTLLASTLTLLGCAAHDSLATRPPCPGAAWVEGHYGAYGHWHPGHWVCPAPVVAPVATAPVVVVPANAP